MSRPARPLRFGIISLPGANSTISQAEDSDRDFKVPFSHSSVVSRYAPAHHATWRYIAVRHGVESQSIFQITFAPGHTPCHRSAESPRGTSGRTTMSSVKIGLAAIGSLIALTASASAEVRYNGFPKLGYSVVLPAPALRHSRQIKMPVDAPEAELPKAEMPAPHRRFARVASIAAVFNSVAPRRTSLGRNRAARLARNRTASSWPEATPSASAAAGSAGSARTRPG